MDPHQPSQESWEAKFSRRSRHQIAIHWEGSPQTSLDRRFSRLHHWHWDQQSSLPASSSPLVIPPPWSDPKAIDPELAMVGAIASCHMMSFLWVARHVPWKVISYADHAEGVLTKDAQGKPWLSDVRLAPTVVFDGPAPDAIALKSIHQEAHHECYIARSVRSRIWLFDHPLI